MKLLCSRLVLLHTVSWWMDREGPNVTERCAGETQPACDLVWLSHHILAVWLHCIRGLCRPLPLSPVKLKLDALNSKPIFCPCQLWVMVLLFAPSVPHISCSKYGAWWLIVAEITRGKQKQIGSWNAELAWLPFWDNVLEYWFNVTTLLSVCLLREQVYMAPFNLRHARAQLCYCTNTGYMD